MSGEQPPPEAGPLAETTAGAAADAAAADAARAAARGRAMDRRSWYMPREVADALASAVEELHFTTRRPKHVIMTALVTVALEHLGDVRRRVEEAHH
ncbi:hypothetical protein GQS52_26550 [Streptomyces sp. SCUT-3]|uniref:hypothetical protein n=1 Tax=Streptomyces TaxID=1883 RepID=UPI0015FBA0E9|nr:hypothetical protein [Streptomyces sp. SCUT-3]QMV24734.1 hypothetical protein GQS52_26550 [Streptomyces sp. SCUT-3]